jgi:hypothetical protein
MRYCARHFGQELRAGGGHVNHHAFSHYDSVLDDDGRLTNDSS